MVKLLKTTQTRNVHSQVIRSMTIDSHGTFERFEVLHSHSEHCEFVQLPGHGVTSGDHGR